MKTIILAAGGTGGHVFPALALGAALRARGYEAVLVTDSRISKFSSALGDAPRKIVPAGPLSPKGIVPLIRGVAAAFSYFRKIRPAAVVGFGGYPSFPGIAAGILLGIPVILHEQNSYMGKVNRWLAKAAKAVALSFPETRALPEGIRAKSTLVGNPVRPQIKRLAKNDYSRNEEASLYILITGGSQGSSIFSEVVPPALAQLPQFLKQKIVVTQQVRPGEVDKTRDFYMQNGIRAGVAAFIDDMHVQLSRADLVICRSGASTLAEITVAGRPSILVPYPHATEDHQTSNARWLTSAGAAVMIPQRELSAATLTNVVSGLLQSVEKRANMAAAARSLAMPDAEEVLADLVLKQI